MKHKIKNRKAISISGNSRVNSYISQINNYENISDKLTDELGLLKSQYTFANGADFTTALGSNIWAWDTKNIPDGIFLPSVTCCEFPNFWDNKYLRYFDYPIEVKISPITNTSSEIELRKKIHEQLHFYTVTKDLEYLKKYRSLILQLSTLLLQQFIKFFKKIKNLEKALLKFLFVDLRTLYRKKTNLIFKNLDDYHSLDTYFKGFGLVGVTINNNDNHEKTKYIKHNR